MIFYFSATGNSKFVANKIANSIGCKTKSIVDVKDFNCCDEVVGLVCPTYCWGLPHIVEEFLQKLVLPNVKYFFIITTYGTVTRINYKEHTTTKPNALFSVKMPDTWTPIFNLSNKTKIEKTLNKSLPKIEQIIDCIKRKKEGNFLNNKVPDLIGKLHHKTLDNVRKTKTLSVNKNCIGCGLCAKNCPVKAIEMQNQKPVWVKEKCEMCLGCLHHCPKFAIQRGKNTSKHGQYDISKYLKQND